MILALSRRRPALRPSAAYAPSSTRSLNYLDRLNATLPQSAGWKASSSLELAGSRKFARHNCVSDAECQWSVKLKHCVLRVGALMSGAHPITAWPTASPTAPTAAPASCAQVREQSACSAQPICAWKTDQCVELAHQCVKFVARPGCQRNTDCQWKRKAKPGLRCQLKPGLDKALFNATGAA
jgi:hypothetical protein